MDKPKLNHMAIMCREPDGLKGYYRRWFGFEELGYTEGGTIHLTDGYFNMALMKERPQIAEEDQGLGLYHIGFHVENIEEIKQRLREFDPSIQLEKRPREDTYSEYRIKEPDGDPLIFQRRAMGLTEKNGFREYATLPHAVKT